MINLHFEKIYSTKGRWEPCSVAVPFGKGKLKDCSGVRVYDENKDPVPTQARATALYPDRSIKWLFVRFMAKVPALKPTDYFLDISSEPMSLRTIKADEKSADTGSLSFRVSEKENTLFDEIRLGEKVFDSSFISAPQLKDGKDREYDFRAEKWELSESGEVCAVLKGTGFHSYKGKDIYKCEIKLFCYIDKPWIELAYRIINTTEDILEIKNLEINHVNAYASDMRCATGISNYKTRYRISENGSEVKEIIDDELLLFEANEHNAEVFYGTFFADCTDSSGGLCATVYQAQQNFPKAISADKNGLSIKLVPQNVGRIIMQGGMAREQRILFDFHTPFRDLSELNDTSIRYQMPNKPQVSPEIFKESGIIEDIFCDKKNSDIEMFLQGAADGHMRCYGMLNWGDSPDMGYTMQGRGGNELVWTNNEYDYSHACALMYERTGIRRFLDYMLVSGRHWLDVDICHFSSDPLYLNGHWEHTNGHCKNKIMECSHQWVEGLLDYYHFTGDEDALKAAIEIGNNDLRQLNKPQYSKPGSANARDTGWALRVFIALYKETNDEKWLEKCDRIVSHFEEWEKKYGLWLSPYTDNTHIRSVFMISIAAASLMRYYRVRPQEKIKAMILRAVDDLIENARLDNGLFYYKELPSLKRFGNNPIILEALTIAYELTGDIKYLEVGMPTFNFIYSRRGPAFLGVGQKKSIGDTVTTGGQGTKGFAQMLIPVATYYTACLREDLIPAKSSV